jgi:predicted membrane GTPase involved in stress response
MTFGVNTSPLNGTEGQINTFPAIKKRLEKEVESNISLSLKKCVDKEAIEVTSCDNVSKYRFLDVESFSWEFLLKI